MPVLRRVCISAIYCALFLILLSPTPTFAQVVINEFSAKSDPEWIELYNTSLSQTIDLTEWEVVDGNTKTTDDIVLSGCITPQEFRLFEHSKGWLNDDGDTIQLLDDNENLQDTVIYFSDSIPSHNNNESTGRSPDGGGTWTVFENPTPSDSECSVPTLTPTSTSTPAPTNTPTPTPTPNPPTSPNSPTPSSEPQTATYKINEVKDEDGNTLSNVEVYVDGVYVHHYAPEILEFCDGCKCDDYIDCGFGEHTIKLEKSGYQNWSKTITVNAGSSDEVDPIMNESASASISTPTPTCASTSTPTITASSRSPTTALDRDLEGVLGEELATESSIGSIAGEVTQSGELISPAATPSSKFKKVLGGIFLFLGGLTILGASAFPLIKKKILVKIKKNH